MNKLKLFILLLFCYSTSFAQQELVKDTIIDFTQVSGTWTTGYNFIITKNIKVNYNDSLTIDPGVNIFFREGCSLTILGKLRANGWANLPINFDGYFNTDESAYETWNGLFFNTSENSQPKASQISYANINCRDLQDDNFSTKAIYLGQHIIHDIHNIDIRNADVGIYISGAAINDSIRNSEIHTCNEAININWSSLPEININHCQFTGIFERSVSVSYNYQLLEINVLNSLFDNSGLDPNSSLEAIQIIENINLDQVWIKGLGKDVPNFISYSKGEGSIGAINIENQQSPDLNIILEDNYFFSCGKELNTVNQFGAFNVNYCNTLKIEDNRVENCTGLKSGAGLIKANIILHQRNDFTGNENRNQGADFGGAVTFLIGQRINLLQDKFENNASQNTGGAILFKQFGQDGEFIDILADRLELTNNHSDNTGGGIYTEAVIDTLSFDRSVFNNNYSTNGSGGSIAVISPMLHTLCVKSTSVINSRVDKDSYGGFFYLTHQPNQIPEYWEFSFLNDTLEASGSHPVNTYDYSFLHAFIRKFPNDFKLENCSIKSVLSNDGIIYFSPHGGFDPFTGSMTMQLIQNYWNSIDGTCMKFINDSSSFTVLSQDNFAYNPENSNLKSQFLQVKGFEIESFSSYIDSISGFSSNSPGSVTFLETLQEIKSANIINAVINNCLSTGQSGGQYCFISHADDPSDDQVLSITGSSFDNYSVTQAGEITGTNGGSIYYSSPGIIDSLSIIQSIFNGIRVSDTASALYLKASNINYVINEDTRYVSLTAGKAAGAIYLNTYSADIEDINIFVTEPDEPVFIDCNSMEDGGAMLAVAEGEIGKVSVVNGLFEDCFSQHGNGGFFCFYSNNSNEELKQEIKLSNLSVLNSNLIPTGGDAGAFYYSSPGNLDSLNISACFFSNLKSDGNGGALFLLSSAVGKVNLKGSEFNGLQAGGDLGGGAVYIKSTVGSIGDFNLLTDENLLTKFDQCTAQSSGGAIFAEAAGEVGKIFIDSVSFIKCKSLNGNGGALSFVSKGYDYNLDQKLEIYRSDFNNGSDNTLTGKNDGGALYYLSQGDGELTSALVESCDFSNLGAGKNGGAVSIETAAIGNFYASCKKFHSIYSQQGSGGVIYLKTTSGGIGTIRIQSTNPDTVFYDCHSLSDGGVLYASAKNEIGEVDIFSTNFKSCYSDAGDGGAFCLVSNTGDESNQQNISVEGCSFNNSGKLTGGNGGSIFFKTPGELNDFMILNSVFSGIKSGQNGGAVYCSANELFTFRNVGGWYKNISSSGSGGVFYVNSNEGNIGTVEILSENEDLPEFEECSALYSGGILYVSSGSAINQLALSDLIVTNNKSTALDGGCFYVTADRVMNVDLASSFFENNYAQSGSGGVFYLVTNQDGLVANFISNDFSGCSAKNNGGILYVENAGGNPAGLVNFSSNNLVNNVVSPVIPDFGGSIYCKGLSRFTFENDSIYDLNATRRGGAIYIENTRTVDLENVYAFRNKARAGGFLYYKGLIGAGSSDSLKIMGSAFLFNEADSTGGCLYLQGIDNLLIGNEDQTNVFIGNKTRVNSLLIGGGAFYSVNASIVRLKNNSFYANIAGQSGGVGYFRDVSGAFDVFDNDFVMNNATILGGAFSLEGTIANSTFSGNYFFNNKAGLQGGAIFSPPSVNQGNILLTDNVFLNNGASEKGGALSLYRPADMVRNQFVQNYIRSKAGQGTGVYLFNQALHSQFKNCVFDRNKCLDLTSSDQAALYIHNDDASITPPDSTIFNCTFLNQSMEDLSIFYYDIAPNNNIGVLSSIFQVKGAKQQGGERAVTYFNDQVRPGYCDMVGSQQTENFNIDSFVDFFVNGYYFDSLKTYPPDELQDVIDHGKPTGNINFDDKYRPVGYHDPANDMGVSGGPENVNDPGSFLLTEPSDYEYAFDIVTLSHNCYNFEFICTGDSVELFNEFYWFFPDKVSPGGQQIPYTFPSGLSGDQEITVLAHNSLNPSRWGIGKDTVNLDLISISSLTVPGFGSGTVELDHTPFDFTITANLVFDHQQVQIVDPIWEIIDSEFVTLVPTPVSYNEVSARVLRITAATGAYARIRYECTGKCDETEIEVSDTIDLTFNPSGWGVCDVIFSPEIDTIPNEMSFVVNFECPVVDAFGNELSKQSIRQQNLLAVTGPCIESVYFDTIVNSASTQVEFNPVVLCDGLYTVSVNPGLFTSNYQLAINPESRDYYVVGISEHDWPGFSLYPNPFDHTLNLVLPQNGDYLISVTNIYGSEVYHKSFSNSQNLTLGLTGIGNGVFILKITNLATKSEIKRTLIKISR